MGLEIGDWRLGIGDWDWKWNRERERDVERWFRGSRVGFVEVAGKIGDCAGRGGDVER